MPQTEQKNLGPVTLNRSANKKSQLKIIGNILIAESCVTHKPPRQKAPTLVEAMSLKGNQKERST